MGDGDGGVSRDSGLKEGLGLGEAVAMDGPELRFSFVLL